MMFLKKLLVFFDEQGHIKSQPPDNKNKNQQSKRDQHQLSFYTQEIKI